jgi:hypothetical protein
MEGHKYPNKLKANWNLLGQGKSTETIKKSMLGKWTIKWGINDGKSYTKLKEYEDISNDDWNLSAKNKGEVYLNESMDYKEFFKEMYENQTIVQLSDKDVLSYRDHHLFVNGRPFQATDPDESLDWIVGVENNNLVTKFKGRSSLTNRWSPREISGFYLLPDRSVYEN